MRSADANGRRSPPLTYLAATLGAVAAMTAPAAAHADYTYRPADQAPAPVARFVPLARSIWPASACAGREQIAIADPDSMPATGSPAMAAGGALLDGSCSVVLSTDELTDPEDACKTVVHEFGHLALGPAAFTQSNPDDPAHSRNPRSIMFYDPGSLMYAPCARAVGGQALTFDASWVLMDRLGLPDADTSCHARPRPGVVVCRLGRHRRYRVTAATGWSVHRLPFDPRTQRMPRSR